LGYVCPRNLGKARAHATLTSARMWCLFFEVCCGNFMKNWRSGVSNLVTLVFLAGLTGVMIAVFSSQGLRSGGTGASPVLSIIASQASPLAIPYASTVQIGEPVRLSIVGTTIRPGDQSQNTVLIGQDNQSYTALVDLDTGKEVKLANKSLYAASTSGHWVVFENRLSSGQQGANSWIGVLDSNSGAEITLGNEGSFQQEPSISGDIVVWTDWQNWANSQIEVYGYNLQTNQKFPVATGPGVRRLPKVSGDWVIYVQKLDSGQQTRSYAIELRAHSLKTDEDFSIGLIPSPDNASWGTHFAVDGDKVVWVKANDASNFSSELHLYDLVTRSDLSLTESTNQTPMDVSLSSKSGIAVYNTPAGRWSIMDWVADTPAPVFPTYPVKSSVTPTILVSGDYLIWRYTNGEVYVASVER
jgi:beta propeller repeat protein